MNPPQGSGLAYSGTDFQFRDGQTTRLTFTKLPIKDPTRSIFVNKSNDIRLAKLDPFPLYIDFTPMKLRAKLLIPRFSKLE